MFLPVISVDICRWQSVTNESSVHSNWGRHLFISISQWQGLAGAVLPSPPPASSHWSAGQGVVITRRWEVRVSSVTPHSYLLTSSPPAQSEPDPWQPDLVCLLRGAQHPPLSHLPLRSPLFPLMMRFTPLARQWTVLPCYLQPLSNVHGAPTFPCRLVGRLSPSSAQLTWQ